MNNTACRRLKIEDVEFDIVVGLGDGDPISEQIIQGVFSFPPPFHLLFALMQPGFVTLDLGAHVGTFSLAAAALGCQVVAVEASSYNAAILKASVSQNNFDRITVLQAAVTDHPGVLEFVPGGSFGLIANPAVQSPSIQVPAVTVDSLLADMCCDRVNLVKMDVEGSEVAAVRGMSHLLAHATPPAIVFESNGHTLHMFDETPQSLLAALEEVGYRNYLVEPGRLVPVSSEDLQPECVVDYLAVKKLPPMPDGWRLDVTMSSKEVVRKVLATCAHPHEHYRAYAARALEQAQPAIRGRREVQEALDGLCTDSNEEVRKAAAWWIDARPTEQAPVQRLRTRVRLGITRLRNPGSPHRRVDKGRSALVTSQDPASTFQIEDVDIDAEEIMKEIRARLRARREEALARGFDWEAYADGLYPVPPEAVLSRDLHEAVRYLSLEYDKANVEMELTETQLPLIGGLVQRVRAALHELVLFYVNRLAARQIRVNYQASRAMVMLVRDLEAEVRDLHTRVQMLESARQDNE